MSFTSQTNYVIGAGQGILLTDAQVKYQQHHYKAAMTKFEQWVRAEAQHTLDIKLNYFGTLASRIMAAGGQVSDEALFDLQRWLMGRQVCYCHHMLKGDANDGHLRPIEVAMELIAIFKPAVAEDLIAKCTPFNMRDLVQERGSEHAQQMYSLKPTLPAPTVSQSNPLTASQLDPEEKRQRMSRNSWRSTSSDSSFDSDRSTRSSSLSSTTSISSMWSRRTRSLSPAAKPSVSTSTWASRVTASAPLSWRQPQPASAPKPVVGLGKLVLKTGEARRRSI